MQPVHFPVLYKEVLDHLVPAGESPLMVDCTLGEGGHSELFLERYKNLSLIGLDADSEIQSRAGERLAMFSDRVTFVNIRFDDFWQNYNGPDVDLILFDLGISIFHYEMSFRGFSFLKDERLDMRLDKNDSLSAFEVVNYYDEKHLADIIFKYGEERYSRRISKGICGYRSKKQIQTSAELARVIYDSVPVEYRHLKNHPATKTFQAIRIEVNDELNRLERALKSSVSHLADGGTMGVITFHSLEDRIVKWFFRNNTDLLEIITKKPLVPTDIEIMSNPPSRSAKLRVVRKKR